MHSPQASIWKDAPEPAIPDSPAIFTDSYNLWLAYETAPSTSGHYAIVKFTHVIDHRLSPINDEGLGKHPYAKAGLKWYSFNEIMQSKETTEWSVLKARHWVVTFKDNTLDVVATGAEVVAENLEGSDPMKVLTDFFRKPPDPA